MMRLTISVSVLLIGAIAASAADLPADVTARIRISPDAVERQVSPTFVGINLHPGPPRPKLLGDPDVQNRVKSMGIKTIRFPNGCVADVYNWKNPPAGWVTVRQFLDFCEAVEAEAYYTLNLQGGTDGLEGPPPADAGLDQRIRHRHTAPNPCGDTKYHFGTLAEAVELLNKYTIERALAGGRPITHYELGNENWGQATTDWPPDVYGKTCEVWAAAFREALAAAQREHPEIADLELYIVAVGYPTMGNNQDPFKATNREINLAWTRQMNRLADLKLIDAVQEHFYPYGHGDGSTLVWTVHNLGNILHLRYGVPNLRLGGYQDPDLAYSLPMEWTEWNVKCWGPQPNVDLPLVNGNFEAGEQGWTTSLEPAGRGSATAVKEAARRGGKGLRIATAAGTRGAEARQTFAVAGRKPVASFGAAVWVRTNRPGQTHVLLRQVNDGPGKG
ncbi:MAG: hypothetical protein HY718_05050, partial [Planctomycetes bacterium]|nr:hypothetical protein [Planctomycetota bacterium]